MHSLVKINNIDIWYETKGDSSNPAVLMIMGACATGLFWPDSYRDALVAKGFYVIRYDHRDTGLSSSIDFKLDPYSLNGLADDAFALLDTLQIQKAHVVGTSMGGYIALLMAIKYPQRVLSLSLLASTTNLSDITNAIDQRGVYHPIIAAPTLAMLDVLTAAVPAVTAEQVVGNIVHSWRVLNGTAAPFDEKYFWHLAEMAYLRERSHTAAGNHLLAIRKTCFDQNKAIQKIKQPTLIIHGTHDPILPLPHGESIARLISRSKLHIIQNMGHMLTPDFDSNCLRLLLPFLGA